MYNISVFCLLLQAETKKLKFKIHITMLNLSKKAQLMPASPIRKLVPYADEAKKRGIKVYHLNIGQPDIESPKEAIKAVKDIELKLIEYPHSAGIPSYRNKLAKYYQNLGMDVNAGDMLITNGGSEAISMAISIICNPDDEIIVLEPFYTNYASFALQNDAVFKPITCKIENGFALPPMEEFEKAITPKTKAILICNPGNPTGTVYTKEELEQLGEIISRHNLYLISDEVYREFCYDGKSFTSILSFPEYADRVICIDSFSKRFSMCGARVGAIVTRNKEVLESALKLAQARLCPPMVEQRAATAALTAPAEYVERVRECYEKRRNTLIRAMQRIPGVRCSMPKGAFYFVADLPVDDAERFALFMLRDFNLEGNTVMFAPAEDFYVSKGLGRTQARFAYVINEEELEMAARCLEAGLKAYRKSVMGL